MGWIQWRRFQVYLLTLILWCCSGLMIDNSFLSCKAMICIGWLTNLLVFLFKTTINDLRVPLRLAAEYGFVLLANWQPWSIIHFILNLNLVRILFFLFKISFTIESVLWSYSRYEQHGKYVFSQMVASWYRVEFPVQNSFIDLFLFLVNSIDFISFIGYCWSLLPLIKLYKVFAFHYLKLIK